MSTDPVKPPDGGEDTSQQTAEERAVAFTRREFIQAGWTVPVVVAVSMAAPRPAFAQTMQCGYGHGDHTDTHVDSTACNVVDMSYSDHYDYDDTYSDDGHTDNHYDGHYDADCTHDDQVYYDHTDTDTHDDEPAHDDSYIDMGYTDAPHTDSYAHSDYGDYSYSDNHTDGIEHVDCEVVEDVQWDNDQTYTDEGYTDGGYSDYNDTPYSDHTDTGGVHEDWHSDGPLTLDSQKLELPFDRPEGMPYSKWKELTS